VPFNLPQPADDHFDLPAPEVALGSEPAPATGGTFDSLKRGLRSSLLNLDANAAATRAVKARQRGDQGTAQREGLRAAQLFDEASAAAPRVSSLKDVHDVGDATDFAAGVLGGVPTAAPAVAGGVVGGLVGRRLGMPGLGANLGAGAGLYDQSMEANVGRQVQAEQAGAPQANPDQTLGAARKYGLADAAANVLLGPEATAAKSIVGQAAKPSSFVRRAATEGAYNAAGNVASEQLSQMAQDELNPTRDKSGDQQALIDAAAQGPIGSLPFSAVGHGADALHARLDQGAELAGKGAKAAGDAAAAGADAAKTGAAKIWDRRPQNAAEAAIMVGEGAAHAADSVEGFVKSLVNRDSDERALLKPQTKDTIKTPDDLAADDARRHEMAGRVAEKVAQNPDAYPQYVRDAVRNYQAGDKSGPAWQGVADSLREWNREQNVGDGFRDFAASAAEKAGKAGAGVVNWLADVRDVYKLAREESRQNAQLPPGQEPRYDLGTYSQALKGRDKFSVVLEDALRPLTGLKTKLAQDVNTPIVARGLRDWIGNGFSFKPGGEVDAQARALSKMFEDPEAAVMTAYDLMKREGLVKQPDADARLRQVLADLSEHGAAVDGKTMPVGKIIEQYVKPSAVRELRMEPGDYAELGNRLLNEIQKGGLDKKTLGEYFGDPDALLTALEGKLDERRAESGVQRGDAARESIDATDESGARSEATDMGGDAAIEDIAGMTDSRAPNTVGEEVKWHHYRSDKAGDVPYERGAKRDVVDPETGEITGSVDHDAHAEKRIADMRAKNEGADVKRVGYIDHLRERYADQPDKMVAEISRFMEANRGKLDSLKPMQPGEKRRVETPDAEINRKFYVLREGVATDRGERTNIGGDEFKSITPNSSGNRWAEPVGVSREYGDVSHGKIWFKRADGKEFATSASRIIKRMAEGVKLEGKDTGSDSLSLAGQRRLLAQGIASMLTAKGADGSYALDGRIGFMHKPGSSVDWSSKTIPDTLRLYSSEGRTVADAKGAERRVSLEEAMAAGRKELKRLEAAERRGIENTGTVNNEVWAKIEELKTALKEKNLTALWHLTEDVERNRERGALLKEGSNGEGTGRAEVEVIAEQAERAERAKPREFDEQTGQPIHDFKDKPAPARSDEQKARDAKQTAFLLDALRKGVPAFNAMLKGLKPEQRAAALDRLRAMVAAEPVVAGVKHPVWGDTPPKDIEAFRNRARLALKAAGEEPSPKAEAPRTSDVARRLKDEDYSGLDTPAKVDAFLADAAKLYREGTKDLAVEERLKSMFDPAAPMSTDLASFYDGMKGGSAELSHEELQAKFAGRRENAQTPGGRVVLPVTGPYTAKDQVKSDKATKFIGRGSAASSTAKYAAAWGDRANSGVYDASDRVFVSAEGNRSGRLRPDTNELRKAIAAGATFITDDAANRQRLYNLGEREVAAFLNANGYKEVRPGEWEPAGKTEPRRENAQSTEKPGFDGKAMPQAEQDQLVADVQRRLGDAMKVEVKELFGDDGKTPISGDWTPGVIRASIYARYPGQIGAHESMHELFNRLTAGGPDATKAAKILLNAASSQPVLRQLQRILRDEPAALKQIADGAKHAAEERLAYAFQFWQAGMLKVGPETEGVFTKIANFLRKAVGLLSDDQKAQKLFEAFEAGKMPDADAAARVLANSVEYRERLYQAGSEKLKPITERLGRVVNTTAQNLESMDNQAAHDIVRLFNRPVGEGGGQSFYEAKDQKFKQFSNKLLNVFHGAQQKDLELAAELLHTGGTTQDPVIRGTMLKAKRLLRELHGYMTEAGVKRFNEEKNTWEPLGHIENYFPRVYDTAKIVGEPEKFIGALLEHNRADLEKIADKINADEATKEKVSPEDVAKAIMDRLTNSGGAALEETAGAVGFTPFAQQVNKRTLHWIAPEVLKEYGQKDMAMVLTSYVAQAVKRAEYVRRFGNDGEILRSKVQQLSAIELGKQVRKAYDLSDSAFKQFNDAFAAAKEPDDLGRMQSALKVMGLDESKAEAAYMKAMQRTSKAATDVMALEGTLGYDVNPKWRKFQNSMMVYQNLRALGLSLFSQMIDPLGLMVRGATMSDAWNAYIRGVKEVVASYKGERTQDDAAKIAETVGTVDAHGMLAAYGQLYSSLYMGNKFRAMNEALFKYNGMEGFNRGMQIAATQSAIGFIKRHVETPTKNSKGYLGELNLKPGDVKIGKDGNLDYKDPKIQNAIHRWVNGAVLRPNAAQRPAWASDPHYMIFWHMKQFAYTFHDVIMKRAIHDVKKYGDATPAAVLVAGFTPVMIAADAAKSLLLTGQEPAWMKAGLGSEIQHGAMRAGLTGRFQPATDSLVSGRGLLGIAGPTTEQLGSFFMQSPSDSLVQALPGASIINTMAGGRRQLADIGED
jgi:hypothetical protein